MKELEEKLIGLKAELAGEWKKKKKDNGGDRDYDKIAAVQAQMNELKIEINKIRKERTLLNRKAK